MDIADRQTCASKVVDIKRENLKQLKLILTSNNFDIPRSHFSRYCKYSLISPISEHTHPIPPNSPFPQQQQCYHSVSSFERNQSHDSGAVYRLFAGDLR